MGNDPAFQQIPHTGPTVVIEWYANGAGWQGSTDESWAIDDVFVSVSSIGDLPSIELMWVSADTLELSYKGVLQESEDLIEWVDFSPQPISPYRFGPSGSRKFYRARSY
jgi:hypothetical protein